MKTRRTLTFLKKAGQARGADLLVACDGLNRRTCQSALNVRRPNRVTRGDRVFKVVLETATGTGGGCRPPYYQYHVSQENTFLDVYGL